MHLLKVIAMLMFLRDYRYFCGSLSKTNLAALQRLQDQACSIVTNAGMKDSWSSTPCLNVENLSGNDRNVMTYKIINRLFP